MEIHADLVNAPRIGTNDNVHFSNTQINISPALDGHDSALLFSLQ